MFVSYLLRSDIMTYASQTLRTKWPELVESSPLDTVGVRSVAGWLKQVSFSIYSNVSAQTCFYANLSTGGQFAKFSSLGSIKYSMESPKIKSYCISASLSCSFSFKNSNSGVLKDPCSNTTSSFLSKY